MPNIITHTLFAQEIFDKVDENTHDLLNLIKDRNYNLGTNDHKEMINFDLIYEK